jgi:DnaJ-class molecular chaperone
MSEPHDANRCTPCRGTGSVISGLGGEPKPVTCPWCQGSGVRIAGLDAQAAKKSETSR